MLRKKNIITAFIVAFNSLFFVSAHSSPLKTKEYSAKHHILQKKADSVIFYAMNMLGTTYRYGGSRPEDGMDCSGLIQHIFRKATNISLPRTSREMSRCGVRIKTLKSIKAGDLIFFHTKSRKRINHVGLYIGEGKFIHTLNETSPVHIGRLNSYWLQHLSVIRRIIH